MNNRTPRNTATREALKELAWTALLTGDPSGQIERQEREGQREVMESTTLPTLTNGCTDADLEALGFRFGSPIENDPMFREATLPDGWKREGSDHAIWSYVVDERGIRRVSIFYKAAFYDRDAFMGIQNVGGAIATQFIYGDDAKPRLHPLLTEDEKASARASAEDYVAQAEEYPDIYRERLPRAWALIEALDS